jgi:glycine cleavage system transcriptional repressor
MPFFAITAVGQDRPGIVAEFTGVLYRQGANLEDSTMTHLRDQFAMMLVVEAPEEALAALDAALQLVATQMGLSLVIRPLSPENPPETTGEGYLLRVYGADRPGIVHAVTSSLAQRGYNITDLNTRVIPGGGGPVYVMLLEVQAPAGADVEALAPELERLGSALGVEVSYEPLASEAL